MEKNAHRESGSAAIHAISGLIPSALASKKKKKKKRKERNFILQESLKTDKKLNNSLSV